MVGGGILDSGLVAKHDTAEQGGNSLFSKYYILENSVPGSSNKNILRG